jgi:regulator of cell morphogenesis and NO signaling
MSELNTQSLAQIVTLDHRAAAIFEKYHLDFCCKGKRSLQQACTEQQLPVDEITTELQNIFKKDPSHNENSFEHLSLTQLVDYIVSNHHDYVKKEMPQIMAYLQRVASKHGDRHPEMYKVFEFFAAVKEEMEMHMQKEELILFPRIKELEKLSHGNPAEMQLNVAYLQGPITVMEHEHDNAGNILNEIRILTNDYTPPADACTTYRLSFAALKAFEIDLHQHVHLENNILFPKALELFSQITSSSLN